ncbi:GTPase IMAP family member 8-like [Mugil cephalus]|uniref:GTPase IMAP family member 8-like n=1 Tax=Mugil cephalus TaxID=48193 RepID=UPI001FB81381|nr:GTPase IMAP family member 8-like [Mugil cephalus]
MAAPPDLIIVLLGNAGVGKSASGNTILGQDKFESRLDFKSVTTEISTATGQVFGKTISVTDTPGILDSEQAVRAYCEGLRCSEIPRLFLVVVKIDRFTPEQSNAVDAAIRIIGDQDLQNSYMLFTRSDLLNKSLEEFIQSNPEGPLALSAARFAGTHEFNNVNGEREQVRQLLLKSRHLRPDRDSVAERRLVLLGVAGDGKSSTGNTILGSDTFSKGCNFNAVTTESTSASARVEGRQITVVDTPGFTAAVLSPEKLYQEIVNGITKASPGPHVFIIVVKIGRGTEAGIKLFEVLPKLFGKDSPQFTMIVFTHGDELRGQSLEEFIQTERRLSDLVKMCNYRYCVFDNTSRNKQQVINLLGKVEEMVTHNHGKHCKAEMFYDVQCVTVKISVKWKEFLEWFKQLLESLDSKTHCMNSRVYIRFVS